MFQFFPRGFRANVGGEYIGMAVLEFAGEAPDTFGLPEYKVSEMRAEIEANGHDVRCVFGSKRFGQINWLYTVICSPDDLMRLSRQCEALAIEAMQISRAMDRRWSGH
jgi:hypothetical protein